MKNQFAGLVLAALLPLAAIRCGESPEAISLRLRIDGHDTSGGEIKIVSGLVAPVRTVRWQTYTVEQPVINPYDRDEEPFEMVGNVKIAFTADFSSESFDDVLVTTAEGEPLYPIIFLDSTGKERLSPFITETDDTGRYVLGLSILTTGCFSFEDAFVQARVMGDTISTAVSVESSLESFDQCTLLIK